MFDKYTKLLEYSIIIKKFEIEAIVIYIIVCESCRCDHHVATFYEVIHLVGENVCPIQYVLEF